MDIIRQLALNSIWNSEKPYSLVKAAIYKERSNPYVIIIFVATSSHVDIGRTFIRISENLLDEHCPKFLPSQFKKRTVQYEDGGRLNYYFHIYVDFEGFLGLEKVFDIEIINQDPYSYDNLRYVCKIPDTKNQKVFTKKIKYETY